MPRALAPSKPSGLALIAALCFFTALAAPGCLAQFDALLLEAHKGVGGSQLGQVASSWPCNVEQRVNGVQVGLGPLAYPQGSVGSCRCTLQQAEEGSHDAFFPARPCLAYPPPQAKSTRCSVKRGTRLSQSLKRSGQLARKVAMRPGSRWVRMGSLALRSPAACGGAGINCKRFR